MQPDKILAALITKTHLFNCRVATQGQRLQEILNNTLTTYLQIHDVSIARLSNPKEPVATFNKATILKSEVNLTLLPIDSHEAPERRMYAYVQKNGLKAFLTVASYDIQGYMHFSSRADPVSFLALNTKTFVPVTQAKITHGAINGDLLESPVVLVRKAAISFLHFGD